ncbi:hypothetical protein CC80DRAFT_426077, partial [Byssothecium circinans]
TMILQRRYSVTGQTPPDDVGAMKPQTHAGDGLQSSPKLQPLDTSAAGGDARGRKMSHHPTVRTSSKRSATQLPSPNTPSSHELPTKIARLGLEQDDMDVDEGCMTDPLPEESDWALSSTEESFSSSSSCSPISPPESVSDEVIIEPLRLLIPDDSVVEDLALSPPTALPFSPPQPQTVANARVPLTLLTMPPEIRHEVYRHLPDLVLPHPLIYCLSTFANNMQHPLASVSRLVRSEALAIFYSYNTWVIKLEFQMMYEAFQDWIIRLGNGAGFLRIVTVAVRSRLFKPKSSHAPSSIGLNGQMLNQPVLAPVQVPGQPPVYLPTPPIEEYSPPDGDASFRIDLSEKFPGGRVEVVRCDGTKEAGEQARVHLAEMVARLWERRRMGTLNGQDWVNMVDDFLRYTGWW